MVAVSQNYTKNEWKFSEIIADPTVRARWEKVRRYFFLRESTYDMTNRCNIRCEGCYYYEGAKQFAIENRNMGAWRRLMDDEKQRGITYVVLAGAEPSLVPELCAICFQAIPLGAIATNGLKVIPKSVNYKIHISVWGNDETSLKTRNAEHMLARQIKNYRDDARAVFVYTFTRNNVAEAYEVTQTLAENKCRMTFNVFSSPVRYEGCLRHTEESLRQTGYTMAELMSIYPDTVIFSPYNIVAHTHPLSLHGLYSCSYPRMNPSADIGLGRSFRQYRTDLTWDRSASCCVPDTDCADCRHYAAGSAVVTARLFRHACDPDTFKAWLDYVDTYLSVWVMDYEKGANLCDGPVQPPGDWARDIRG
ncbi:Radical SAM domain protein [uncultured Desulfobacterium sp.]|uniref:Radical SAM domain protein n=1 Tax=uncultured Desulfobacterium sp. TaxID=201089 RepID=A0A445MZA2_9BACT|nr:Radical SAM domain protein [uncultured Desulfobacterium sp.]